jgi:hypothetical protein
MIELYKQDKSTIFSIAPFGGEEFKPGLYPGRFLIPPCKDDREPVRLVVGASEHLVSIAGRKQPLRVVTPSMEVANSVVTDYLDGQLFSAHDAKPGLCWLQGDVSVANFIKDHKALYDALLNQQRKWFVNIVKHTQDDWNKYHHSRVVSDQARFAVRVLGLDTPEWMTVDSMGSAPAKCPACGETVNPEVAWCPNCIQGGHKVVINLKKFEELMKNQPALAK